MICKRILDQDRLRKIEGSFSWIDHRFITAGFLKDLSTIEILLYLFLVAVSDRHGISFYHDDSLCAILKIPLTCLGEARQSLILKSLIAYEPPLYQVLSLPPHPVSPPTREERRKKQRERNLCHIRKIRQALP
jgi:hypothetical protein